MLAFLLVGAGAIPIIEGGATCFPHPRALPPLRHRGDLGWMLRQLHLTGPGVELGVKQGEYTKVILSGWKRCETYVQVDVWHPLDNYADVANVAANVQAQFKRMASRSLNEMVGQGYAKRGVQCQNFTTVCARNYPDQYFDFIYVDARHDRLGVLEDLVTWWPKLKRGGVIAGHDYTQQTEPRMWTKSDPTLTGQNWTLNYDGTVDHTGRTVKGAVDDFFSGQAPMSHAGKKELRRCPLQVMVTYREQAWNTWVVAKP